MSEVRRFVIPLAAKGKQRPRMANGHAYTPRETRIYEDDVKRFYISQCHYTPYPKGVALRLVITFLYAIPQSASMKQRQAMLSGVKKPTVKPDLSNAVKTIEDALNGLAYYDDAQITDLHPKKRYAIEASILVEITEDDE